MSCRLHFAASRLTAAIVLAAMLACPALAEHGDRDYPVRDQETIRKTFDLGNAAGQRVIEVDNVNGSIEVVGTDSNQVQLIVIRSNRAESQEKLDAARKEVTLDVTEQPGSLKLYVDGPFRCCWECGCKRSWRNPGYSVEMDFQLQVPRSSDIKLSTVNSGEIRVRDIRGKYSVHNVNGSIEMLRVAGAGRAATVNGEVKVTFLENPREDSSFESVNGDIDLHFVRGLSADFRFTTFNGDVYSDFPVTSLPRRPMQVQRKGSKTLYRTDRFAGGRIGSGGIEVRIENLNGDIRIRENHE